MRQSSPDVCEVGTTIHVCSGVCVQLYVTLHEHECSEHLWCCGDCLSLLERELHSEGRLSEIDSQGKVVK